MATDDRLYTDRARAESFGSVAADYDRYRPSYPSALITELADLAPDRVLDVACGTGKVAVPLLACGIAVLGVEVDPQMAVIARSHGIIVEIAPFETWDDAGRRFDLVTCGQGWHWIDPEKGPAKAAQVLNPGGTLALFWNHSELSAGPQHDIDEAYRSIAPELVRPVRDTGTKDDGGHVAALEASGLFASVEVKNYHWNATVTAEEWVGRAATHSDHLRLPSRQRVALLDAVRGVIDSHGGTMVSHAGTYTIFARKPER